MRVVVTAGHVDHGKSALIRALTGMEPDRWAEERRRGMTIDLGFAWLTLPSGSQMAFVDVPGHERFVTNMLAGAGPVPAVLFVVAADEGWMPQSAEHLAALHALGISRGLLVVTKSDLADPAPAMAQAAAQIARSSLGQVPAVAVSSVTGAGMTELAAALDELAVSITDPDPGAPVRIWIDRAFSVSGSGTVVTGTLPAGTVHRDDELVLTPSMRPVRVRELQSLGEPADTVPGIARIALNLRAVSKESLHRGMALVQPGRWTLTDVIDVRLMPAEVAGQQSTARPVQPAVPRPGPPAAPAMANGGGPAITTQLTRTVTLHIGSARTIARLRPLGPGLARLSLADPLPLHPGDRVLLRDPGSRRAATAAATAGAVVLDVAPPPLARRGAAAAAARLLASWPEHPAASDILARQGIMRASALHAMGITDHPVPVCGEWLVDPDRWRSLSHQLGEVLATHAAADPLAAGMPIEAARAALDLPDRRLVTALAKPPFRISCGALQIIKPSGSLNGPDLPEPVQAAVRILRADLETSPFLSPDADRLRKLGLDTRSIAAAVRAGELMRISDQVVLAPGADEAAARILAGIEQPFTAAEARQALDTTRRTAIPLLEYLDSAGITERLPDDRRVLRGAVAPPAGPAASAGQPAGTEPPDAPAVVAGPPGDGLAAAGMAAAQPEAAS
jgi:selenocysteine-specific elongation factor